MRKTPCLFSAASNQRERERQSKMEEDVVFLITLVTARLQDLAMTLTESVSLNVHRT